MPVLILILAGSGGGPLPRSKTGETMFRKLKLGQTYPLMLVAGDKNASLFGKIEIRDAINTTVLATINADHTANGVYIGLYAPSQLGSQRAVGEFFTDSGRTISAFSYGVSADDLEVVDIDESTLGTPVTGTVTGDIAQVASGVNDAILQATQAATQAQAAATASAAALVIAQFLEKKEKNRWKVIGTQLFYYDNDGVTVLMKFDLKDSTGAPSSTQIFERVPVLL